MIDAGSIRLGFGLNLEVTAKNALALTDGFNRIFDADISLVSKPDDELDLGLVDEDKVLDRFWDVLENDVFNALIDSKGLAVEVDSIFNPNVDNTTRVSVQAIVYEGSGWDEIVTDPVNANDVDKNAHDFLQSLGALVGQVPGFILAVMPDN